MYPLCHTLSKALLISKKITLISFPSSRALLNIFAIYSSWFLVESFIVKPDYLTNRKQRVVINGKESSWKTVNAGVPQGSILGPLLFLIFISDIVDEVNCPIKLFADDTIIFNLEDAFVIISLICVVQDPSLEKGRPRCLCVVTFLMGMWMGNLRATKKQT
jgi:hypothetical protein